MSFLAEKGGIPGLYFQANNDNPGGGDPPKPMQSMVPEGAIIPEDTIPPETHVDQAELNAAAAARGKLMEQLG